MEGAAAIIAQADQFARRLREWDDRRVERQIAEIVEQERKTIDIRVEEASDAKATQKLQASFEWVEQQEKRIQALAARREQLQKFLGMIAENTGKFTKNWFLLLSLLGVGGIWGGFIAINFPPAVICQSQADLCYLLRVRKVKTAFDVSNARCTKSRKGFVCTVLDPLEKGHSKPTKP